jgi:hypothetical protein
MVGVNPANLSDSDLDDFRTQTALKLTPENIQYMEKRELLLLQSAIGLGNNWGVFNWPTAWHTIGLRDSIKDHHIDVFRPFAKSEKELDLAVTTITRITLIYLCIPTTSGKMQPKLIKPSSIRSYLCTSYRPLGTSKNLWSPSFLQG